MKRESASKAAAKPKRAEERRWQPSVSFFEERHLPARFFRFSIRNSQPCREPPPRKLSLDACVD